MAGFAKMARMGASVGDLVHAVSTALEPVAMVRAALLFGSQAKGTARADSDVDVAVLLDHRPEEPARTPVLRTLIEALGTTMRADRLDLVILNGAPPKLAFNVLRDGRVALCRDPVELHRFKMRTWWEHADFEPTERFFREVVKRRAMQAVSRG